jgi:multidrug resistance protein
LLILRNPAFATLFAALFIIMVGFGIIIPVLPFYARDLGASAFDMGLLMTTFSLMQFVCTPFWGSLCDRVGRKPVLLVALFGDVISFVLTGLAGALWVLFLARFLGGLLSSGGIPASMAYIADVTSEKERGSAMGMMGAAMGLGMIVGPAIGGIMTHISLAAPFFAAAGTCALTMLFIAILLPESLPPDKRQAARPSSGRFREMQRSLSGPIALLMVLALAASFVTASMEGVFGFWMQDQLGLQATDLGILFAVMGVTTVIVQGGLTGRMLNALGDEKALQWGLVGNAAGFFLLLLCWDLASLAVVCAFWAVAGALLRPALSTIVSKRSTGGQGAAMGMMGSFDSLGRIAGPLWGGYAYNYSIALPYLTGGIVLLLGGAATMVNAFWRRDQIPSRPDGS